MLFNSLVFCVFFLATYTLYLSLSALPPTRQRRLQNLLLLAASYVFYGWWDWRFCGLIALSTLIDFFVGRALCRTDPSTDDGVVRRKILVTVSVAANLTILGFFKYFNFFADSLADLLSALGMQPDALTLSIILPVGISFYTFQTLSYTIDVYRGRLEATTSFVDFALFVSFFPQLVAGPIERASHLLPQIAKPRKIGPDDVWTGLHLIVLGYFEKVVIADNIGRIADEVFNNYERYQGLDILVGALAFALQIFGDFSGYSNIARGVARLMGFDLMVNFRLPYFATSPADFWRRWHISLSTWLRDYLYIPLGGNRWSRATTYRNLLATMLLGGLWHGAAWNFVMWGAYHGLGLVVHRAFLERRGPHPERPGTRWLRIAPMLIFTLVGWIFFRARSAEQLITMLSSIGIQPSATTLSMLTDILFYAWPLLLLQIAQRRSGNLLVLTRLPAWAAALVLAFAIASIGVLGSREPMEFIYFQF
jgi:alginate O-acetyltransferase complex protein AlgI